MILKLLIPAALSLLLSACNAAAISLDDAIALGKQRALKLESPRIDRSRIEGQITEAWSNALPQLDGLVSYQRAFKAPILFFPDGNGNIMKIKTQQDNTGYSEVSLTQPVYTFGRIGAGLQAAYSARRANEHLSSYTEKSLEMDIMRGFWSVLLLKGVLDVRKEAQSFAENSLDRVMKLRDVGLMSDFDVLRARAQVSAQIPPLHQSENDLQLAKLALNDLLGVPLDTSLTVEGDLSTYDLPVGVDTSFQNALNRDDLEALRDAATAYENGYIIYKNAGLPTIGAQGKWSWQWGADNWKMDRTNSAASLTGGLALSIPLWSSGKNSGKAQQMKADWRKAKLDLLSAERGVQLQVTQAKNNFNTARINEDATGVAVEQATEARKIAEIRLVNGQITQLELQSAQMDETAAKLSQLNARYTRLVATAELRLAVGKSPSYKN
jgi:outer membrane protein